MALLSDPSALMTVFVSVVHSLGKQGPICSADVSLRSTLTFIIFTALRERREDLFTAGVSYLS